MFSPEWLMNTSYMKWGSDFRKDEDDDDEDEEEADVNSIERN